MELNNESNVIKEKIDTALKKLLMHQALKQQSVRSSHYNFGIEKPFVNDRCNLRIKAGPNAYVKCQIIFDSKDYNFPPDIVFHDLPKDVTTSVDNQSIFLPGEDWDLQNEDCLYNWFTKILELIVKEPSPPTPPATSIETKPKKNWSLFESDEGDDDVFAEDVDKNKKNKIQPVGVHRETEREDEKESIVKKKPSLPDIEFIDDDFYKYTSSCEVVDTATEDRDDEMDIFETTAVDDNHVPDVEVIASSSIKDRKGKRKLQRSLSPPPPPVKSIGRISANLASFKKNADPTSKLSTAMEIDDDDDDTSIFECPPSVPSSSLSLHKKPSLSSPKRQTNITSAFKSPLRNSDSTSSRSNIKMSYSVEQKQKEVVDLILDDTDDVENYTPPSKVRKTECQAKIFDLGPSSSNRKKQSTFDTNSSVREEFRKKFMTIFLTKFKKNIISYDSENFEHVSFYFTFGMSTKTELWQRYTKEVQVKLERKGLGKLTRPKTNAPVIVNFKMDKSFPSNKLKIKVISVVNTTMSGAAEPESMNLQFTVKENENTSRTIENIMTLLEEKVPAFHCQLPDF